ncbi:Pollen Ole e 1 allergen/extensin [Quillaja saponaria]|uniref:Pollen Ole e 1 allergen/extensin n=1 Tax=Quillaja saponaria TaxID=32244 RepID=A0AAD7M0S0_QUISA|nr:Pollen Ole e 1 allergen/extensin [Quillaja saponaria]
MSYFCGCHNLVMTMLLLLCFIFFLGSPATGHQDNPLFELSSREEFVQMAGYGEQKLSTVLITGSVHCEACLQGEDDQRHAWPIPGALVVVNCHASRKKSKSSVAQGLTDEFGDFIIDLPSHLHAIPNLEKLCSVRVLRIPNKSLCKPTNHGRRHKGIKLSSFVNGIRTYSASFKFLHLTSKPLHICTRKRSGNKDML